MEKIKVLLRELGLTGEHIENKELLLPGIPNQEDKIVLDIDGTGYVFKILEIHFAEAGIDIYVQRVSNITEYESKLIHR